MTKIRKIISAAVAATMLVLSLYASLVYAADDVTSKFSEKLLEYYETNDTEVKLYIHYEDTVDLALIDAQAAENAEAKVEELREEGGYTEEELQESYESWYEAQWSVLYDNAYQDLAIQMQTALGLEDSTTGCYRKAAIFGYFTYEEALVIAESELVLSLTRAPEIESGQQDFEDETSNEETTEMIEDTAWYGTDEPYVDSRETVGDFDDNGVIDAADASYILSLAANIGIGTEPSDISLYIADYNSDGKADATDASLILIVAAEQGAA